MICTDKILLPVSLLIKLIRNTWAHKYTKPYQNKQAHQHIRHTDCCSLLIEVIWKEGPLTLDTHGSVTRPSSECSMGWIDGEQELPALYSKSHSVQLSPVTDSSHPNKHPSRPSAVNMRCAYSVILSLCCQWRSSITQRHRVIRTALMMQIHECISHCETLEES